MNPFPLPLLVLLEDYSGVWNDYFEVVYKIFYQDFVLTKPVFRKSDWVLNAIQSTRGNQLRSGIW